MKYVTDLSEYCNHINIPQPRYNFFDVRTFEEKNSTVKQTMPPFRHAFYAIALVTEGEGRTSAGSNSLTAAEPTVYFNTPYQILSWDILPNWTGFYIIFTQEFIAKSQYLHHLSENYPFMRIDKSIPFKVSQSEVDKLSWIYQNIREEYDSGNPDKFLIIESLTILLLNFVKRCYSQYISSNEIEVDVKDADLKIITQFQTLIQTKLIQNQRSDWDNQFRTPAYYAEAIGIHPNHLNAVVKRITGKTATSYIHSFILHQIQSYLNQTKLSIKEIAFAIGFDSPNSLNSFFKKYTGVTPMDYRKSKTFEL